MSSALSSVLQVAVCTLAVSAQLVTGCGRRSLGQLPPEELDTGGAAGRAANHGGRGSDTTGSNPPATAGWSAELPPNGAEAVATGGQSAGNATDAGPLSNGGKLAAAGGAGGADAGGCDRAAYDTFDSSGGSVPAPGDVNWDGEVTIVDALMIGQCAEGVEPGRPFYPQVGDLNCDGSVDREDAMMISEYSVGNISEFAVCEEE